MNILNKAILCPASSLLGTLFLMVTLSSCSSGGGSSGGGDEMQIMPGPGGAGNAPPPPTTTQNPNLDIQSESVTDATLFPGQRFSFEAKVRNTGSGRSGSTTLTYYRSTNSNITSNDDKVGTDSVRSLDPDSVSSESIRLNAPIPGIWYYGACVDAVSGDANRDDDCTTSGQRVTVSGTVTTISWEIEDECVDGANIDVRFFSFDRNGAATGRTDPFRAFGNIGGSDVEEQISCSGSISDAVADEMCFGGIGTDGSGVWGVGPDGRDSKTPVACRSCSTDVSLIRAHNIQLTCP